MKYIYQLAPAIRYSFKKESIYRFITRFAEIMLCTIALIVLLPMLVLISLFIRLDSKGPAFFKQERLGKDGRSFLIVKFRTMSVSAEANGPQWAVKNDPRVTKVGHYLRKFRIDEIPQFINVIRGEMTLVGPRPERPCFYDEFEKDIPGFKKRLAVKPGLTGWAQINGGYDLTPEEKLELDLYYIQHASLKLDLKILLSSIPVVLFSKGWR